MTGRVGRLWVPAVLATLVADAALFVLTRVGVEPREIALDWHLLHCHHPLQFYVPWLVMMPVIGAVAAAWSRSRGATRGEAALAALFPPLAAAGLAVPATLIDLAVDVGGGRHPAVHTLCGTAWMLVSFVLSPGLAIVPGLLVGLAVGPGGPAGVPDPRRPSGHDTVDAPRLLFGGMSREGLPASVLAVAGMTGGLVLLLQFGRNYLDTSWRVRSLFFAGVVGLVLAGWMATRLARRRDYPWLMFVAAVALPLFQPQNKPDRLEWRLFGAACGLLLMAIAVYSFVRMVARTDELERRVNQEALAFAFGSSLLATVGYSLLPGVVVVPPLEGQWVAAAMIATWLVGWNRAWRRYR